MLPKRDLPFYVEGPANIVGNLPYVGYSATLHGFLFRGQRQALQAVADTMLNKPAYNNVSFRVVTSYVFFSALYQPRVQSADPVDQAVGYVPEIDLGFWILTYGGHKDQNPLTEWAFRWLPVWLFVDSASAIATGREVFGYPKMHGRFEFKSPVPTNPSDATVSVWTPTLQTLGHDECATERKLLWLAPKRGTIVPPRSLTPARGAKHFRAALLADKDSIGSGLNWGGVVPPMLSLLGVEMPMVFLKQFRDATEVRRACYQSIVAVTVKTRKVHEMGFFPRTYRLHFNNFASHPIGEVLGIESGAEPSFSFWVNQDFEVGFGEEIWRA